MQERKHAKLDKAAQKRGKGTASGAAETPELGAAPAAAMAPEVPEAGNGDEACSPHASPAASGVEDDAEASAGASTAPNDEPRAQSIPAAEEPAAHAPETRTSDTDAQASHGRQVSAAAAASAAEQSSPSDQLSASDDFLNILRHEPASHGPVTPARHMLSLVEASVDHAARESGLLQVRWPR